MQGSVTYHIVDIACPECSEVFQQGARTLGGAQASARSALAEHLYLVHLKSRISATFTSFVTPTASVDEAEYIPE